MNHLSPAGSAIELYRALSQNLCLYIDESSNSDHHLEPGGWSLHWGRVLPNMSCLGLQGWLGKHGTPRRPIGGYISKKRCMSRLLGFYADIVSESRKLRQCVASSGGLERDYTRPLLRVKAPMVNGRGEVTARRARATYQWGDKFLDRRPLLSRRTLPESSLHWKHKA